MTTGATWPMTATASAPNATPSITSATAIGAIRRAPTSSSLPAYVFTVVAAARMLLPVNSTTMEAAAIDPRTIRLVGGDVALDFVNTVDEGVDVLATSAGFAAW